MSHYYRGFRFAFSIILNGSEVNRVSRPTPSFYLNQVGAIPRGQRLTEGKLHPHLLGRSLSGSTIHLALLIACKFGLCQVRCGLHLWRLCLRLSPCILTGGLSRGLRLRRD
jgi:hypothetical protein